MKRREFLKMLAGTGCTMALGGLAKTNLGFAKEAFPARKIIWIVGHPPGGGIDMMARGVVNFMDKHLKARSPNPDRVGVLIKNLPGGAEMRAMNELYITHTEHRTKYGREKSSVPSRFLQELPEEAIKKMDRFEKLDPEQEKVYAKKCFANIKAILGD